MSVSLTKIVGGNPAIADDLPNTQTVTCPRCNQAYRFAHSDRDRRRLKDWQRIATTGAT